MSVTKIQTISVSIKRAAIAKYPIIVGNNLSREIALFIRREAQQKKIAIITHPGIKKMFGGLLAQAIKKVGNPVEFFLFPPG